VVEDYDANRKDTDGTKRQVDESGSLLPAVPMRSSNVAGTMLLDRNLVNDCR
jgi:hypothetical protein